jgi:recombination protein RecT
MSSKNGMDEIKGLLASQGPTYKRLLPPEVTVDVFTTIALNAFWQNPDLLQANRKSIVQALLQACRAGLLPDGREGVISIYDTKQKVAGREVRVPTAQWIPMVAGLIKLTYATGARSVVLDVVRQGDEWLLERGDTPRIEHRPLIDTEDERDRPILFAYAVVTTADDVRHHAWVSRAKLARIRAFSRAGNGPLWTAWFEEAAKKTAMRALWKTLPIPVGSAGNRLAAAVTAHDADMPFDDLGSAPQVSLAAPLDGEAPMAAAPDPLGEAVTSTAQRRRAATAETRSDHDATDHPQRQGGPDDDADAPE